MTASVSAGVVCRCNVAGGEMISIGIDSHRDSLAVCVLDEQGVIIAEREFANTDRKSVV